MAITVANEGENKDPIAVPSATTSASVTKKTSCITSYFTSNKPSTTTITTVTNKDENKDPSAEIEIEEEEEEMPWEQEDWVPKTSTGKPKTPNMIRNQLQKYIDTSGKTQTYIVSAELQVNNKSFRNFMNPKTYKNQWSATSNGTYWAAARLLEKHAYEQKQAKKKNKTSTKKKRKSDASDNGPSPSNKKTKSTSSLDMEAYMQKVNSTCLPKDDDEDSNNNNKVYDSCPEVIKKIKDFLARDGVTKTSFCSILGGLNHNSLNRFLSSKKQDGAGMVAYERAYVFFEKMRLLEGKPKSKERIQNELAHGRGFALRAPSKWCLVYVGK